MRQSITARHVAELERENEKLWGLLKDLAICACGKYCYGCPHQYDGCDRDKRLRELAEKYAAKLRLVGEDE